MISFHGCIHNLTLNGDIVSLDRLAGSDSVNGTRLPVALCPADVESLSVPCRSNESCTGGCVNRSLNACDSSPCGVNSTCVPTSSGYTCLCPPGSTGSRCLDRACPMTCLHGGTCVGARCQCMPGRTGARCETDVDECASSPCANGGTCLESGGPATTQAFRPGYRCVCRRSFRGANCQLGVCDDSPCPQRARCHPDDDDQRGYRSTTSSVQNANTGLQYRTNTLTPTPQDVFQSLSNTGLQSNIKSNIKYQISNSLFCMAAICWIDKNKIQ